MKLLIFDADGTLFNSHYALYKVWLIIAKEFERNLFDSFEHFEEVYKKHHGKWEAYAVEELGFQESDFEKIVEIWLREVNNVYKTDTCWFDDIINIINKLEKRGYTIAIATNNEKNLFYDFFSKEGMNFPVHDRISHREVQKPNPDMILDHANNLGFSLENTVMIGDTLTDLAAARNAGVVSIWAEYGSLQEASQLEGFYDYILKTPKCLLEIFK